MRFTYIFASLLFYLTLSTAWPWPANLFIRDASGQLARRDSPPPSSSSASPASSVASSQPSSTGSSAPSGSGSASGSSAPSSAPPSKPSGNSNKTMTSSISITQAEAGGVSMLNPPATTTTYYKLGQNITFAWNYTSLVVTPTAVDVVVSCQSLGATYTLAANMTVAGNGTASVVWDTAKETTANPPPDTDKYTLAIWDAGVAAGPTQTVGPGLLGVWDQFTFAMYTPQPYTALGDGYVCVTCNGALSSHERQALSVLFATAAITVLSFTYFSSGFLSL